MKVVKRSGRHEDVKFDQITDRLKMLSPDLSIDPIKIARSVCAQIKEFITTRELDELSATICASLSIQEPEYDILGTRILMTSHEKDTPDDFVDVVRELQNNKDILDQPSPILDPMFAAFVLDNAEQVSVHYQKCCEEYDMYQMSLFGWKTLYRSYLLQSNRKVVERPQHLFYRVALSLHYPNLERTEESYRNLAKGNFIHATPTLFHAGTKRQQLSSCFLTTSTDDVDGIYKNISNVAKISKWAGGIGVHISHIRSKNSYIRGTNGFSNGIMPMLRVYNDTSRYIDQCVHGTTPVYTIDGPKPIYMLEPKKDYILQRNGRYEVLKEKLEHPYKGDVLEISMCDGTSFLITPEHPIYGRHVMDKEYDNTNNTSYWIDTEDVRVGDELAFPVPSHTCDVEEFTSNTLFCWGLLLGWGKMSFDDAHVDIFFPVQTPATAMETFQYFLSTQMIYFQTYLSSETIHLRFQRTNLFPIKYHHLYHTQERKKHIHPSLLHLPITKLSYFVQGFLMSHGTYLTENAVSIVNTSEYQDTIFESLSYLFVRLGIVLTLRETKMITVALDDLDASGIYGRPSKNMDLDAYPKDSSHFRASLLSKMNGEPLTSSDNLFQLTKVPTVPFVYKKITKIEKSFYDGLLYDLEFEKEHSYAITSAVLHNGGGKRKGSFAMYLEPWHADIFDFVFAKRNVGNEDERARDLFYGLWIPDLFMKRVEKNDVWSLMCPNVCKGLVESYGEKFEELYTEYEKQGKYVKQIQARELWKEILHSQIETGLPYMLYKDSCNSKSNQKNLGTIRSSNLCVAPDTVIYTDKGYFQIQSLSGQNVNVWNGKKFNSTVVLRTGVDQEMMEIHFSNGTSVTCTPYHHFYVEESEGISTKLEASQLKPQMNITPFQIQPIECPNKVLDAPYIRGTCCAQKLHSDYFFVPVNYSQESRVKWFEGFSDAVGKIRRIGSDRILEIQYTDRNFLQDIFYLLQTLGVPSILSPVGATTTHTLQIDEEGMRRLWKAGYEPKILPLALEEEDPALCKNDKEGNDYALRPFTTRVHITKVLPLEKRMETYCFNESSEHKGVFNGILAGNCCEIIEYSDANEYSVCNLASINLSNCVKDKDTSVIGTPVIYTKTSCAYCQMVKKRLSRRGIEYVEIDVQDNQVMFDEVTEKYGQEKTVPKIVVNNENMYGFMDFWKTYLQPDVDYDELAKRVSILVINMNEIIDKNFYPTPETEVSNHKHRPIGIGVQGLADLFCKLYLPFDSEEAKFINKKIFETMYFSALKTSNQYAVENNLVYSTFQGSPLSQGTFHFDMCPNFDESVLQQSPVYDWESLRTTIKETGVSNSLFLAPMPTASTSQILYQNECFEPFTSNLYVRRTLAGEYTIFNKYLVQDLRDVGLWSQETIDHLIVNRGSIQNFTKLPATIRRIYRTAWEIPQKSLIDMAAERQWFIDQSQSFNLFVGDPSLEKLTKIHFYGWKRGLKTGSYYIRTKPQHFSQNFTIDPTKEEELTCTTCSA